MENSGVPTESSSRWSDLNDTWQEMIIGTFCMKLNLKGEKTNNLRRIFGLGNPLITIGMNYDKAYFRIEQESKDVLHLLIKNYL